jgi:hypothetical protein
VTVAFADFVASAVEVAVTITVAGLGIEAGAVYSPVALMVPHDAPLQPAPESVQVTAVLAVPVTVAVNCCWAPVVTFGESGETETATGATTVTTVEADLVASACEVAVTVTVAGLGMVPGAV